MKFINQSKYNLFVASGNNHTPTLFFNAGATITMDEKIFNEICNNANHCKFYIFKDCGGDSAAVIFQEATVTSISNTMNEVSVLGSGSKVIVKNN